MITHKLKVITGLSIGVFIIHGIEEYLTGFHHVDTTFKFIFSPFFSMDMEQALFLSFKVMLWLFLIIVFLLLQGKRWRFTLLGILGLFLIIELHHIVKAFVAFDYYPGLFSAALFPVLAFFFWKEWVRVFRNYRLKRKT